MTKPKKAKRPKSNGEEIDVSERPLDEIIGALMKVPRKIKRKKRAKK